MEKMILKKNIIILAVLLALGVFANVTSADSYTCANGDTLSASEASLGSQLGLITVSFNKISSTQAQTTIVNNTGCKLPATAQSYKVYDNVTFDTQVRISDAGLTIIPPYSSHTFTSQLAPCLTQVDGFYDSRSNDSFTLRGIIFGTDGRTFDSIPAAQGTFCSDTPPPQTLTGTCSVNPTSVAIGGYLNWSATASGGNGSSSYVYSWTGTDGLYGNSSQVSKPYSSAGTKTGTVTITSGSQSVSYTCSGVVTTTVNTGLSVSCSPNDSSVDVDDDITWQANPSGGNGSYTYSWNGSNGLYGNSRNVTWSYGSSGTKNANVTVISGNESATASCSANVRNNSSRNRNVSVSCYANPSNPQVGQRMNWYADVNGGDGDYDYDWSGTDNLNSSSRSPSMTYYNPGSKSATVRVYSDGDSDMATCYANVNGNSVLAFSQSNVTPLAGAVYLSQVPYTGLADNLGLLWFMIGLGLFSAYIAYVVVVYKKKNGEFN